MCNNYWFPLKDVILIFVILSGGIPDRKVFTSRHRWTEKSPELKVDTTPRTWHQRESSCKQKKLRNFLAVMLSRFYVMRYTMNNYFFPRYFWFVVISCQNFFLYSRFVSLLFLRKKLCIKKLKKSWGTRIISGINNKIYWRFISGNVGIQRIISPGVAFKIYL